MDKKFSFDRVKADFERARQELPILLGNQAKNFFAGSWQIQGFEDDGIQSWAEPCRRIPGTRAYKYPKRRDLGRRTRATLVKSGRLRRAVQDSVREVTFERVRLVVDVPYASAHNEGDGHLPQRKFMGDSATLRNMQRNMISKTIDKLWRG